MANPLDRSELEDQGWRRAYVSYPRGDYAGPLGPLWSWRLANLEMVVAWVQNNRRKP